MMRVWVTERIRELISTIQHCSGWLVASVYLSLLLDNVLLTAVVPIIPDYLYRLEHHDDPTSTDGTFLRSNSTYNFPSPVTNENGKVGIMLASKAFVQLLSNSLVGSCTNRVGYKSLLLVGNIVILASSFLFATGETFVLLFAARAIQGVGSSCVTIAGLGAVASRYPDDAKRSKVIGFTLGGAAVGVLAGYPFGGILYDFMGKATPFTILTIVTFLLCILSGIIAWPRDEEMSCPGAVSVITLLRDTYVLTIAGAICLTTSAMAILEPCLPIWLMDAISPSRWELGTVFIPDSLGYLIGTSFFGKVAVRNGRWGTAMSSMLLVGASAILIPVATSVLHLVGPHFGLGLGIGIVDAALMPLLALLVDSRHSTSYGTVFAIAETAVSLAYCLGPAVAGYLVKQVGFPWVMRTVGILNIVSCPLCLLLRKAEHREEKNALALSRPAKSNYEAVQRASTGYTRFDEETDGQ
ncbi:synaptic vesicular amine transporter-like [Ornithodoros turicata]|uniref:synaptic vesicular amine transporter-like n=1 Tax=Ornithodoros turicata TaxID=34597 RepID=UPI003138F1A4